MYGFKPQHARGKPVQNFADGGIVHSIKGALGLRPRTQEELLADDAKRMAKNREAAAAVAERNKPAPSAPQAQQGAVSGYAGMSATQRREKELGLNDGGHVEPRGFVSGKGTGTSDSIKARLSNGEYVLPADTVKAVGVEALDALRAATHTPVKHEQAKAARGFFAGGTPGGVDENWLRQMEGERSARTQAANAIASEAMAQSQAESDKLAAQSSLPKTPIGGLANNGGADASRFAQVPAPIGTQPNRTPEPAAPSAPLSATQPAAQTAPAKVPLGQMHSIGTRSGAQMVADGARSGAQSFFDSFQKAQVPAAAPSAVAPAGMPGYKTDVQRGGGNVPAIDTATPTATAPSAPAAATTPREVVPGVFNHGRGQYSDQSTGMGMPAGFAGQPSAQNMAAADALSARSQQESMARIGMSQYAAEVQRAKNINADEAARNNSVGARMQRLADPFSNEGRAMRNLRMDIDSSLDRNGRPTGKTEALVAQSKAMSDGYLAEPNQQRTIDAGIQREGMQQAGATERTGMQEQGATARDAGRTALARDEFGLKKEAAGFQTRAAKRRESAYDNYSKAKTDEDRQAIANQFPDLFGQAKDAAHRMEVVRGKTDPMTGQSSGDYVVVQDPKTGGVRQIQMGAGAAPAPQALPNAGEVRNGFRFKGGNPNDQANWTKV